ncbi:MAG TPA: SAM-dependent methyltransferase, partial [Thermodesulfobacteriota bacterium]|nr:SAM-dependent methyltransferase [Thermodesulfobacteriota bacterium]
MLKKILLLAVLILVTCFFNAPGWADAQSVISITGEVKQPLYMSLDDLKKFDHAWVRLNEVTKDKKFHGVFYFHGPSLQTLLDLAGVRKEASAFPKLVDLAIVVRNKKGEQVALSWGEIFYRNPADIILGIEAMPIMPKKLGDPAFAQEISPSMVDQLKRNVGLPTLAVANDFYTDRCIEDITNIEVVDLHRQVPGKKGESNFSPQFTVITGKDRSLEIKNISSYPRTTLFTKPVGEGKGFHGLKEFKGVSLNYLLGKAGIVPDLNSVIFASAPDGYRSLLSYGELFLSHSGEETMIADTVDNQPLGKDGKFMLVLPHDLSADRWVKSVDKIEVVTLKKEPRVYIISIGCSETKLITLEALSAMAKADTFVCSDEVKNQLAKYIGDKPVLFNPLHSLDQIIHQPGPNLSPEEKEKLLKERRAEEVKKVIATLNEGKTVAYLEYGDPGVFGSGRFLRDYVSDDKIEIVPGISAFNVSNALLKRDPTCKGSLVISAPRGLKSNESLVKAIAENGETLVIFMGLKELPTLVPFLQKYY